MTSKDKPTRGGGKSAGGARSASSRSGKTFSGGKSFSGPRPARAEGGDDSRRYDKGAERPVKRRDGDQPAARDGERRDSETAGGKSFGKSFGKPAGKGPAGKSFGKPAGKGPAGKSFGKPAGKGPARDADAARRGPRPERSSMVRNTPAAEAGEGKPERISKLLARAGVASRRDVERMILDGRVRLNGQVLDTPVVNATLADIIEVDGQPIRGIERTRLWLYHKPAGLVTTNADPEGRPTVFDNLPEGLPRVLSIGRLDINTEGLLLLTNDGGLSRVLELPSTGWLRRYRVRAHGEIDQEALDRLKDGIAVDGVLYGAIEATLDRTQGHNVWITMGLREGKNREIKNVLGALGLEVNRLIRISYGPFQLGDLAEGAVLEVRGKTLRDQLGPRLIEDAKANFDAPIYEGPAVPVAEEADEDKPRSPREKTARPAERPARGERPAPREDRSERPRGKPGDKPFARGSRDEEPGERKPRPVKSRTANVWMAPGARPVGEEKLKKLEALRARDRRTGKAAFDKTPPVDPRNAPRVVVSRADDDPDWIRAEAPARDDARKGGFGKKPGGFGKGPRRDDEGGEKRPFFRDRGERSERGDRPERGERGERAERGERPAGKGFGGKPSGGKPSGGRSFGDKPSGGKPSGGKSFGGKPSGGKSFGGKPSGRPSGKPSGGAGRGADRRR